MPKSAMPAGLKILNGRREGFDSGGRPIKPPPPFRRVPPVPPEWLSPEAAAEWQRVAPELARLDLLKPADRAGLAAYCETWSEYVAATRALQAHGGLTHVVNQGEIAHPAVAVRRNAGRELRMWAGRFGLTPSDENSLAARVGDLDTANPFAGGGIG
jgi:P27 family predicted phage terminase small subunit